MQVPLELSFRDVERTEERVDLINELVAKLEQVSPNMTSCRVSIERLQEKRRTGNPLRMRIEVRVPRTKDIVVSEEIDDSAAVEPLERLIRDSFAAMRRRLQEIAERQRGQVKPAANPDEIALVTKLFADRGYGFLTTLDHREIYFHRNSVLHGGFDRLEIGTGVRFVEEEGDKGPQASTVAIIDKPGVNSPRAAEGEGQ